MRLFSEKQCLTFLKSTFLNAGSRCIRTTENAAKMAESESKRNVKRIENRKAKDSKRELVL